MHGLYLHIPFCVRKCLYCDFYSLPMGKGPVPDNSVFLNALDVELKALPAGFQPTTIFVGGGTPTELSPADFARLLDMLSRRVDLGQVEEWTIESNPGTLTGDKAVQMREAGVNRVSLGVQSFEANNLKFLQRIHTAAEAIEGYQLLRQTGFRNVNLDIIFGIPGSTLATHAADARQIVELNPEHTSFYSLIFEEGTPLIRLRDRGLVREVEDEEQRGQWETLREILTAAGYRHYEISNYAKPGFECRHNQLYWGAGEYIGCGPSAHSHWQGARHGNVRDLRAYCDALLNGRSAIDFQERLPPEAKARETLVMSLRRLEGVHRETFRRQTGFDYEALCGPLLLRFDRLGLMKVEPDRIRLSEDGVFVSDAIFAELV